MNTPQQQAELYRKAAETIEMCAEHGIEPKVKMCGLLMLVSDRSLQSQFECYEFPIAVIEGQLVWADTVVYNSGGYSMPASGMTGAFGPYTLTPPKQPLCEVEGKPVYKGDKLWFKGDSKPTVISDIHNLESPYWSWNPPKRTVMVELLVDDAQRMADSAQERFVETYAQDRVGIACRKALDNLKDK